MQVLAKIHFKCSVSDCYAVYMFICEHYIKVRLYGGGTLALCQGPRAPKGPRASKGWCSPQRSMDRSINLTNFRRARG